MDETEQVHPIEYIPPLVKALAEKEGKEPWSWFLDDEHVTIVYRDGHKVRYERETRPDLKHAGVPPKPATAATEETAAPAPKQTRGKPRTSKKK